MIRARDLLTGETWLGRGARVLALVFLVLAIWLGVLTAKSYFFYRSIGRAPYLNSPLRIAAKQMVGALLDPINDLRLRRRPALPAYHLELTARRQQQWREQLRTVYARGFAIETDQVWLPGVLRWRDQVYEVEIRGRGTLFTHYREDKPSFRVRFPADQTLRGTRVANLIIPYDQARVSIDTAINALARHYDLLTYPTRFVTLELNHELLGVYQEVEHFREDLAVKQFRSEGFFVSGLGELKGGGELSHRGLKEAVHALRWCVHDACTQAQTRELLDRYLDFEKLAAYAAITSLVGSSHAWGEDNLILFFDPPRGRFEPMPWDIGVLALKADGLESLRGLGAALMSFPDFRARRDQLLKDLIVRKTDFVREESQRLFADLRPALDFDVEHSRRYARNMVAYFDRSVTSNAELWRRHFQEARKPEAALDAGKPGFLGLQGALPSGIRRDDRAAGRRWVFAGEVRLDHDLVLPKGDAISFEPGLDLALGPGVRLVLRGDLTARGTAVDRIRVRPIDSHRPFQSLIVLGRPDEKARVMLEHFEISGGNEGPWSSAYFTGMLSIYDGWLKMRKCRVFDVRGEDGLNVKFGKVDIRDSVFESTASDAVDLDFCQGVVAGNRLSFTQGDGLDFSGSLIRAENNRLEDLADKGLSVGERTTALLIGNSIDRARTGFAVKDRSWVEAHGTEIGKVAIGAAAYRKKPVFASGTLGFTGGPTSEDGDTRFLLDPQAWVERIDEAPERPH